MTVEDRIEIGTAVGELCRALSLVPRDVKEITVTPRSVEAVVLKVNRAGEHYAENGQAAVERFSYRVSMSDLG